MLEAAALPIKPRPLPNVDNCLLVRSKICVLSFSRFPENGSPDPTAVVLLDLQITRLCRPGYELAYFFCSSTSRQQRRNHFEELLQFYYDRFFQELKDLGDDSEPFFTFDDLKEEYSAGFVFGFIMGFMHAQVPTYCLDR